MDHLIMSGPLKPSFLLKNVNIYNPQMLAQTAFESFLLTKVDVLICQVKLTAGISSEDILVRVLVRLICMRQSLLLIENGRCD